MNFRNFTIPLVLGLLFAFSCDENGEEPVYTDPIVENVNLNYSTFNKTLFISAKVTDPQGIDDIDSVVFNLFRPDSTSPDGYALDTVGILVDNGENGDIIKQDDFYSSLICSSHVIQYEGLYRVTVQAFDLNGYSSEILSGTALAEKNSPPEIYLLEAPTSFEKGDTLKFRVRVSDPQGYDDIVSVTYFIKAPDGHIQSDPTWYMYDDGESYGDEHAKDGIFTVHQPTVLESDIQGMYTFYFVAKDLCGEMSDTLEVSAIKPGVTIKYPNYSHTFQLGNTMTIIWESAYIKDLELECITNFYSSEPTFHSIASVSGSDTSYQWIILNVTRSDSCKIKAYDPQKPSRYDLSDNLFSIK